MAQLYSGLIDELKTRWQATKLQRGGYTARSKQDKFKYLDGTNNVQ